MKPILMDDLRQLLFSPEFRIPRPSHNAMAANELEQASQSQPRHQTLKGGAMDGSNSISDIDSALSDIAVCLWDIERKLRPEEGRQLDRKERLVYRRATKALDALARARVTIEDPTGKRYMQGSEGFMKPIELQPTAGISREIVTETVVPIVYRSDRLIRRGEVFVAVPLEEKPTEMAASDELKSPLPQAGSSDMPPEEKQAITGSADTSALLEDNGKKKI